MLIFSDVLMLKRDQSALWHFDESIWIWLCGSDDSDSVQLQENTKKDRTGGAEENQITVTYPQSK